MLFNTLLINHLTNAIRREVSLTRCALVSALLCCVLAPLPLSAQTPPADDKTETAETRETEAGEATAAEDSTTKRLVYYGRRENHRLRWHFGFGRGEFKAGVVSTASPAWFLNSVIRTGSDPTYQPAIPIEPGGIGKHWSFQTGLQWAYKDRFFLGFNWYWIDQPLGGSNSTTVSFLHPPQSRFRYSYFEGLRLAKYKEDHKDVEFKYLTPFLWRGFKAGFHIAREFYKETNDISYGSFQATNGNSPIEPNSRAWSIGGVVPNTYRMKGWSLGPSFRYKIFNWFTMYYQLSLLLDRTGNFSQAGLQTVTIQNDVTGASRAEVLAPIAGGTAKDSGLRHRLEAEFSIYCRYTVTVGILKEDFERKYGTYGGYTYGSVPYFYSQQTAMGLGIGETSQPHEVSKQEIYVKFGVDFFFGGAESEQRVYNNAYRGGGGSGCPVNRRAG